MNRYLLRSLVAVLTFSIGVAIGSFARPHIRSSKTYYKRHDCDYKREYRVRRSVLVQADTRPWVGPSISVDTLSVDPLKLSYSSATPLANDLARQKVEFLVENNTKREIANFTVAYRSRWRSRRQNGGGTVFVDARAKTSASSTGMNDVSIECDGDENLTIWVSSVAFKDGTRWNNTRHSN